MWTYPTLPGSLPSSKSALPKTGCCFTQGDLDPRVRATKEKQLKELEQKQVRQQAAEREKRLATKYHKVSRVYVRLGAASSSAATQQHSAGGCMCYTPAAVTWRCLCMSGLGPAAAWGLLHLQGPAADAAWLMCSWLTVQPAGPKRTPSCSVPGASSQ
jgi:hypothetical protein